MRRKNTFISMQKNMRASMEELPPYESPIHKEIYGTGGPDAVRNEEKMTNMYINSDVLLDTIKSEIQNAVSTNLLKESQSQMLIDAIERITESEEYKNNEENQVALESFVNKIFLSPAIDSEIVASSLNRLKNLVSNISNIKDMVKEYTKAIIDKKHNTVQTGVNELTDVATTVKCSNVLYVINHYQIDKYFNVIFKHNREILDNAKTGYITTVLFNSVGLNAGLNIGYTTLSLIPTFTMTHMFPKYNELNIDVDESKTEINITESPRNNSWFSFDKNLYAIIDFLESNGDVLIENFQTIINDTDLIKKDLGLKIMNSEDTPYGEENKETDYSIKNAPMMIEVVEQVRQNQIMTINTIVDSIKMLLLGLSKKIEIENTSRIDELGI